MAIGYLDDTYLYDICYNIKIRNGGSTYSINDFPNYINKIPQAVNAGQNYELKLEVVNLLQYDTTVTIKYVTSSNGYAVLGTSEDRLTTNKLQKNLSTLHGTYVEISITNGRITSVDGLSNCSMITNISLPAGERTIKFYATGITGTITAHIT